MNTSGMQKPPLAPKPKIIQPQRPRPCPSANPKQDGLTQASFSTPLRVKPALAPKPCLSTAYDSNPPYKKNGHLRQTIVPDATSPSEMLRITGHLNSRNGTSRQQENRKPDWDYIIPICLCSRKNCLCLQNGDAPDMAIDTIERDLKTLHSQGKTAESRVKPVPRYRPRENRECIKCQVVRNSIASLPDVCVQAVDMSSNDRRLNPTTPLEAVFVSNAQTRANGDIFTVSNGDIFTVSNAAGRGEPDGHTGSAVICEDADKASRRPAVFRKPIPLPRQPGTFARVEQETPEQGRVGLERSEARDWAEARQGMEMNYRKVKEPVGRKSLQPPSVSKPAGQAQDTPGGGAGPSGSLPSSRIPGPSPAPVILPRRKAFLSEPETRAQIAASSSQHLPPPSSFPYLPQDVEDELEWVDDGVYERELSVDAEEEASEKGDGGGRSEEELEEEIYCKILCPLLSTSLPNQTELTSESSVNVASSRIYEEDVDAPNKMSSVPDRPQRPHALAGVLLKEELSGERYRGGMVTATQDGGSPRSSQAVRELPATLRDSGGAAPRHPSPMRSSVLQTPPAPPTGEGSTDNTGMKRGLPMLTPPKPSRSSLRKAKSQSFSSADTSLSAGQKRNSFRRLLELKISVRMLPKLPTVVSQASDCSPANPKAEQCVDGVRQDGVRQDGGLQDEGLQDGVRQDRVRQEGGLQDEGLQDGGLQDEGLQEGGLQDEGLQDGGRQDRLYALARPKSCCTQLGRELSVDGEFYYPGAEQALEDEYLHDYEEITDYMNHPAGLPPRGGGSGGGGRPAETWEWYVHGHGDEENIYEEQEPYHPLGEDTQPQQRPSGSSSIDEDVGQTDDGQSDEDVMVHSSDEDDGSSSSSKGESEQSGRSQADWDTRETKTAHIARETKTAHIARETMTAHIARETKTAHIAREIMSSENVFVDALKLLHIDFREAVGKASLQSGKPVVEERVLNQILYYLPQLYELNQDLLRELEKRVEHWDQCDRLADVFVKKGPYLKMYSTYIREFDRNVALLDEQSRKNQAFGAVVQEFEGTPRCASLALKHYLLKPVQRIPQYQLLLTDYLKNLSPESADYKDTLAALGIMKEVANHANDSMKQGDNFQKLIRVQCSLNGHHEIVVPGRVFLKEGVLMKLSRKVMQPRMFFLFNDALLYTTPVQSGQFKLNNMLSLAGMKVSKPSQEAFQNELTIEGVERSFILSASSAVERDDWLEAICTAIKDHTRKKISFIASKSLEETGTEEVSNGAPLGSKAPIWIPDLRATMCMICTCEFSLTWRRHHCRACGKVVCQSCSSNKQCLEYLKNQLARVCDQCCVILQQQKNDLTPSPPGVKPSFGFTRRTKRIPAALKEVTANTDNSSMSGYLQRSKGNKKQGKRLWFVIKNKVLYTYAASEDVAALESQPLLGFMLEEEIEGPASQKQLFKLYHKNTLHYVFKADNVQTAQRWIDSFKDAAVL